MMIVGGIGKAPLDERLSSSTILPSPGAVGLKPSPINFFLFQISLQGATLRGSGALGLQGTGITDGTGDPVVIAFLEGIITAAL